MRRQTPGLWPRTACSEAGEQTIYVRTVDTYVVVILAGIFHDVVANQHLADIGVTFGMSKNYRFYRFNAIC